MKMEAIVAEIMYVGRQRPLSDQEQDVLDVWNENQRLLKENADLKRREMVCHPVKQIRKITVNETDITTPIGFEGAMHYLSNQYSGDPEAAHCKMDNLMCMLLRGLGYGKAIDIFEETELW